jgi:TPP-dependent indolepyruvate ferredoxin oxidoreductase alpha subunit
MTTNPKKTAKQPEHPLDDLIRTDRIPHIWCPGCGIGTAFSSCLSAIKATGIPYNRFTMVSGIGCSARGAGYIKLDSFHTTHGRAIPFASGIKMANPDLKVIVFSGDGDLFAIGGNHFIHAARRNMDLTVICVNNLTYGMTGGQVAATTPAWPNPPPRRWATRTPLSTCPAGLCLRGFLCGPLDHSPYQGPDHSHQRSHHQKGVFVYRSALALPGQLRAPQQGKTP